MRRAAGYRLHLCGLLISIALVLGGCATGPQWSSDTRTGATTKDPRAAKAPRINLNEQSVNSLDAPSNNLWIHIRNGFQMPELESPLVIQQTVWLAARPEYFGMSGAMYCSQRMLP